METIAERKKKLKISDIKKKSKKKLSKIGEFMKNNKGFVEILDLKAVMR